MEKKKNQLHIHPNSRHLKWPASLTVGGSSCRWTASWSTLMG